MIKQKREEEIMSENEKQQEQLKIELPSLERIQAELGSAKSIDDFFGKEGIFARLFATTLEQMLEAELTAELGYEKYEAKGRNSGNNRNGKYKRKVRSSGGQVEVAVPRDRNGDFEPKLLHKYETSSNELEDKIITLYAKGLSVRDIHDSLQEMYGVDVSASTISTITEKVLPLVESWQNRHLDAVYPLIYLDGIYVNLKREGRIERTAVYVVLAVNLEGRKDVLGHWVGDGAEGAKFWTNVLGQLQTRGVQDILIACVDGLSGFKDAIHAVFPKARVQRCILHQIRNSLKYVSYTEQDDFMRDLKPVYQAATREEAEMALLSLSEKWSQKYAVAVRAWQTNWGDLSAFFDFPYEIRRLIYTNNAIEGYNRQLRKVTKNKTVFSTHEAVRKSFYLAHRDIAAKWTMPIPHWPKILNHLVIYFTDRIAI
jgi:putative transposase